MNQQQLTSPWQLLRDIATWLPERDEQRALRIVEHHHRQHSQAALAAYLMDCTEGLPVSQSTPRPDRPATITDEGDEHVRRTFVD